MKSTKTSNVFNILLVIALTISPFLQSFPSDSNCSCYSQGFSRSFRSDFSRSKVQSLSAVQLVTAECEYCDGQEDSPIGDLDNGFLFTDSPIDPFETSLPKREEIAHLRPLHDRGPPSSTS
jgi:hypothetical protein